MCRPPRRRRRTNAVRIGSGRRGPGTDRGQSTALDYTLALGVAALAVTGLFAATGDFVTSQREQVVRTELDVVGEQLATKLLSADRLVAAGNDTGALVVNASMPQRVAGASYTVSVTDDGDDHWLNLTTHDPEVAVSVRIETQTDLATGNVPGGDLAVVYDPDADRMEVVS